MKRNISASLVSVLLLWFSLASANDDQEKTSKQSVKKTDLKGPKAKNYHPVKFDLKTQEVQTIEKSHPVKELQGPKAKNYSPKDYDYTSKTLKKIQPNTKRQNLQGPKAKNYRPGK